MPLFIELESFLIGLPFCLQIDFIRCGTDYADFSKFIAELVSINQHHGWSV